MGFTISVGGGCDISAAQMAADGICPFRGTYTLGGIPFSDRLEYEYDFDNVTELIESGKLLTRTSPTPADYEMFFDSVLERGVKSIVHISVDSRLSEDYDCAIKAVRNELVKFPRCEIYVVDAGTFSVGMHPLIERAKYLKSNGLTAAEAFLELNKTAKNVCTYFATEDLSYLKRLGKINVNADRGKILNLQYILKLNTRGKFLITGKTRGNLSTAERLAVLTEKSGADKIYLSTAGNFNQLISFRKKAESRIAGLLSETDRMGLFTLSMLGSRAYAVAYLAENASVTQ